MFIDENPFLIILNSCRFQVQVFFYIGPTTKRQEEFVSLELHHMLPLLGCNHFLRPITLRFYNSCIRNDINTFGLEDTCDHLRGFRIFTWQEMFWSLNKGDLYAQPSECLCQFYTNRSPSSDNERFWKSRQVEDIFIGHIACCL